MITVIMELAHGTHITVYDSKRRELGEGTLIRRTYQNDMNLTVYECEEHLILAKGEHFVEVAGEIRRVSPPPR